MSIPASNLVSALASVLAAGGKALVLNGLVLTQAAALPYGAPLSFPGAQEVSDYFGPSSEEAAMAAVYFNGFDGSTAKPGALLFARYAQAPISAFLRGGKNALTLAQVQAITAGTLSITVDGVLKTSATVDLSAATSFSNAAALLTTALGLTGGAAVTYDSTFEAFVVTSGTTGATSTITYATGDVATSLSLTQAGGAVLSQGQVADTPSGRMTTIVEATQNWASFSTVWEPVDADMQGFATWTNLQGDRFLYVPWTTDVTATEAPASYTGIGHYLKAGNLSGTAPVYLDPLHAAFVLGAVASTDFSATNGRATLAYKGQTGLLPSVSDLTSAANLEANGVNFYGAYATANDEFLLFQTGQVSGPFAWIDSYINQIQLSNAFQLALVSLLASQQTKSLPYNVDGYALIKQAMADPIAQAVNFGSIRAGVSLSALQAAQVNSAAGRPIDSVLYRRGWYLQVLDPTAQVRGSRGTPVINFWYMDGQSVQRITLNSINIQ